MADAGTLLDGTPYLIGDGPDAAARFDRVAARSISIRDRAIKAQERIELEARTVLSQFEVAIRSDLVSESDRLEGIQTSAREIRDIANTRRDLLEADVGALLQFIRDDERMTDSLGLYKAYELADAWAKAKERPREFEIRALHSLVMPSLPRSGSYKTWDNTISRGEGQVPLDTTPLLDVPRAMSELTQWFLRGSGDAALDAAVVHAWLTSVHPFEDGNGRMARLLANLALIQSGYPPLLLRSRSDRGQYLDALAASDEGDLLPLYDLFVCALRRVVLTMEKGGYVQSKIRGDLLQRVEQRHDAWVKLAESLLTCLEQNAKYTGWGWQPMGYPSLESFALLEQRNPDGNSWFAKLRHAGIDKWLLWFGFRSDIAVHLLGGDRHMPSIFIAYRSERPDSVHPFDTDFEQPDAINEIILVPGVAKPALVRRGYELQEMRVEEAVRVTMKELVR